MKIKEKSSRGILRRLTAMALALALAFTGIGGGLGFIQAPEKVEAASYGEAGKKPLNIKKGKVILKKGGITYKVSSPKFKYEEKGSKTYIPITAYLTKTMDEAVLLEDIKKKIKVKYEYKKFKVKKGKKYKVKTRKKGASKFGKAKFVSAKKLKSKAFKKKYNVKYVKTNVRTENVTFRNVNAELITGEYTVKIVDTSAFKKFTSADTFKKFPMWDNILLTFTRYKGGVYYGNSFVEGTRLKNEEAIYMAYLRQAILKEKITDAERKYMTKEEIKAFPYALAYWNAFKKWKDDKPKFISFVANAMTIAPYDHTRDWASEELNIHEYIYYFFIKNASVCSEKAYAFKLMCELADIPCLEVSWPEMNHAYNMVKIDGLWYVVDPTNNIILEKPGGIYSNEGDVYHNPYYFYGKATQFYLEKLGVKLNRTLHENWFNGLNYNWLYASSSYSSAASPDTTVLGMVKYVNEVPKDTPWYFRTQEEQDAWNEAHSAPS
jgi:hypothetical protein